MAHIEEGLGGQRDHGLRSRVVRSVTTVFIFSIFFCFFFFYFVFIQCARRSAEGSRCRDHSRHG